VGVWVPRAWKWIWPPITILKPTSNAHRLQLLSYLLRSIWDFLKLFGLPAQFRIHSPGTPHRARQNRNLETRTIFCRKSYHSSSKLSTKLGRLSCRHAVLIGRSNRLLLVQKLSKGVVNSAKAFQKKGFTSFPSHCARGILVVWVTRRVVQLAREGDVWSKHGLMSCVRAQCNPFRSRTRISLPVCTSW